MDKIKVGIAGLDNMLNGGLPTNHQVFLCGGPGTGKTTLAFEYLYRGAKAGENGLFFSLGESPDSILKNLKSVFTEWDDVPELVKNKKIVFVGQDDYPRIPAKKVNENEGNYAFSNIFASLKEKIDDNQVKRVVIDSSTMIRLFFDTDLEFRRMLYELLSGIKKLGCTTLITAELPTLERQAVKFEAEHFASDGLIFLYNIEQREKRLTALEILKMRGTTHSKSLTPFKITVSGISVYVGEKVY